MFVSNTCIEPSIPIKPESVSEPRSPETVNWQLGNNSNAGLKYTVSKLGALLIVDVSWREAVWKVGSNAAPSTEPCIGIATPLKDPKVPRVDIHGVTASAGFPLRILTAKLTFSPTNMLRPTFSFRVPAIASKIVPAVRNFGADSPFTVTLHA